MADGFNQLDQRLEESQYEQGPPASYPPRPDTDDRPIQFQHANVWGRFAVVTGLVSALAGLALLAHAIAPRRLGIIGQVAVSAWAGVSLGFALVTVALVIIARHTDPGEGRSHKVGTAGIVLLLCGILFTLAGFIISSGQPDGFIREKKVDRAPIDSAQTMTREMDQILGPCPSDWKDMDPDGLVGVSQIRFCSGSKVGYVVFSNDSAASLAKGPIRSQVGRLMDQYGGQEVPIEDLRVLSGKRWMVVGNREQVNKLQAAWGGQIETLDSGK